MDGAFTHGRQCWEARHPQQGKRRPGASPSPRLSPKKTPAKCQARALGQKQATSASAATALTHKPRSRRRGHCCPLVVATHHHRGARSDDRNPKLGPAAPMRRPQLTSPPPLITTAPPWGARPPALHNRHRPQGRQIQPPDLRI
jgi:hypothetical protein